MPSSVVLRSHRFLFTLLSTHNTTRPRTHRRKMERGRRRWRRRRKWEKEMPPPMSGLEISRNLCQRNWWGNAVMLVVLVVDVQNSISLRVLVNCISVHQIRRAQRNNNKSILVCLAVKIVLWYKVVWGGFIQLVLLAFYEHSAMKCNSLYLLATPKHDFPS